MALYNAPSRPLQSQRCPTHLPARTSPSAVARPSSRRCSVGVHKSTTTRCQAFPCFSDGDERWTSPVSWHEQEATRSTPPEPSVPSTSGRDAGSRWACSLNQPVPASAPDALGYEEAWDGSDDGFTPFPSNLPTGGASSADASFQTHDLFKQSLKYFGVQEDRDQWRRLSQVWVLLFGVGTRETEGIYSLRCVSRDTGMPQDTIIAFEDAEDAQRYAGLLEATMEHVPHVSPIAVQELLDFCQDSGYKCRLEPAGTMLYPPDYNIGMTDWERSLRLRGGHYEVLETEPERKPTPAEYHLPGSPSCPSLSNGSMSRPHNNAGVGPPPADVEDARTRLERQWL